MTFLEAKFSRLIKKVYCQDLDVFQLAWIFYTLLERFWRLLFRNVIIFNIACHFRCLRACWVNQGMMRNQDFLDDSWEKKIFQSQFKDTFGWHPVLLQDFLEGLWSLMVNQKKKFWFWGPMKDFVKFQLFKVWESGTNIFWLCFSPSLPKLQALLFSWLLLGWDYQSYPREKMGMKNPALVMDFRLSLVLRLRCAPLQPSW